MFELPPRNNLELLLTNSTLEKVKLKYELGIYDNRSRGMSSNFSRNRTRFAILREIYFLRKKHRSTNKLLKYKPVSSYL